MVAEARAILRLAHAFADEAFVKLKRTTDAELDQAIEQIQRDVADRNAELHDGLRYVLAGCTRDRWTGVALLGSGVILSGVGSIVGNLRDPPLPGSSTPRVRAP